MSNFHKTLSDEIAALRKHLSDDPSLKNFTFVIHAYGDPHGGDLKINMTLSDGAYTSENKVSGIDTGLMADEFLRRRGWNKRSHDLLLTADNTVMAQTIDADDDEKVPF